jgi:hypothetical protein
MEEWGLGSHTASLLVHFSTGYGDLSPSSSISRAFTVCFALYGIIILGIFLGVVGEYIIERNEENMKKRLSNARLRVLQQFGNDDTALPPVERSWTNKIMAIIWAETPVVLLLIILGTPIVILEDWDLDKGYVVVDGDLDRKGIRRYRPSMVASSYYQPFSRHYSVPLQNLLDGSNWDDDRLWVSTTSVFFSGSG